jgi:hypothetical protein
MRGRGEPGKAASVRCDGTGWEAHGERAQQRRGDRKGRARGVKVVARRDGSGMAARPRAGGSGGKGG